MKNIFKKPLEFIQSKLFKNKQQDHISSNTNCSSNSSQVMSIKTDQ